MRPRSFDVGGGAPVHPRRRLIILSTVLLPWLKRRTLPARLICKILPDQGSFPMVTASKAFIAFCLLAVGGTVLVIGPTELRRLLPMGAKTDIAAKPEPKVEPKVEPKPELKPEEPKLAAVAPPPPAASSAPAPAPSAFFAPAPGAEGGCTGRDAKASHGRACRSCTGQAAAGGCRYRPPF